jgi:hypothetical protein
MTRITPVFSFTLSRSGSRYAASFTLATLALGTTLLFTTGCKSNPPDAPDNTGSQPQTSNAPTAGAPPAAGSSSTGTGTSATSGAAAPSSPAPASPAPGSPASGPAASGSVAASSATPGSAAAPAVAAAPAPHPPPPPPAFVDVRVPAGKAIPIRITQTLDSATTQQGEAISGVVATNVLVIGQVVIPQGSPVSGRVTAAHEAAHYKGSSLLSVELTGINVHGQHIGITTAAYSVQGKGRGKNTAVKTGGGAAGGALLGGLIGGGKGAGIGALAGAGAGLVANGVTRGEQVQIPSETLIHFALNNSIVVSVPNNPAAAAAPADSQGRQPLPPPSAQ